VSARWKSVCWRALASASWTGTLCWQEPSPYVANGRKNWYVIARPCQRQFGQNRRLALARLRARLEHDDRSGERAVVTGRWRIHDELVRGNPTRVERPGS